MKGFLAGKVNESVLVRSVLKEISPAVAKRTTRLGVGQDASGFPLDDTSNLLTATATMEGIGSEFITATFYRALNNIYVKQAKPFGVTVSLMLRRKAEEKELKQIMRQIALLCKETDVVILGGETTVSEQAIRSVLTIQAFAITDEHPAYKREAMVSGDIVMTKWAGLAATAMLIEKKNEKLSERFGTNFLNSGRALSELYSIQKDMKAVKNTSFIYAHDVSEGGIFAALWELGEYLGCGMTIRLPEIAIRQETVEVCEVFDINPYVLFSLGSVLLVGEDGAALVAALGEAGIEAAVIGQINETKDRLILNGEETRYLEPFKGDDIYKVL